MRKIFTLILLIKTFTIIAQNVGINATGAAPNGSAMLDVAANNKGVLIPQVILVSSTDNVTIATPANSLLVYNTNTAGVSPTNVIHASCTTLGTFNEHSKRYIASMVNHRQQWHRYNY